MSQPPRWYRKQLLEHKLMPQSKHALDLMDTQDYLNRKKAIEIKLDEQDHQYGQRQREEVIRLRGLL